MRILALIMLLAVLQPLVMTGPTDAAAIGGAAESAVDTQYGLRGATDFQLQLPHFEGLNSVSAPGDEPVFNPYGDPWASRTASNPDIPIGLTPGCHRRAPKDGRTAAGTQEINWLKTSSSALVWEECAGIADHTNGVGDPMMKAYGTDLKAANPGLRYLGYLPAAVASVDVMGGPGPYPVALKAIDATHEDWFVHQAGAAPTKANRVHLTQGNPRWNLYDMTNPNFRLYMAQQIVASLDFHNMGGVVIDGCSEAAPGLDPGYAMDPSISSNWGASCTAFLQTLKQQAGPSKTIMFLGFVQITTEAAAFNFAVANMNVSDGLVWEDPFGSANLAPTTYPTLLARVDQIIDATDARGKNLLMAVNGSARGQSGYPSSYSVQKALAQWALANYLLSYRSAAHVMAYSTPTQYGPSYLSAANFSDWSARIGAPTGRRSERTPNVLQRGFQRGAVYFNASNSTTSFQMPAGYYTTTHQPVSTVTLQPGQTIILLTEAAFGSPATATPTKTPTLQATATFTPTAVPTNTPVLTCPSGPRPRVNVQTQPNGDGRLRVVLTGGAPPFVRIIFGQMTNAVVDVAGGQTGVSSNQTVNFSPYPSSVTFYVRRVGSGTSTVPLTVVDACQNNPWKTLVGGGTNSF